MDREEFMKKLLKKIKEKGSFEGGKEVMEEIMKEVGATDNDAQLLAEMMQFTAILYSIYIRADNKSFCKGVIATILESTLLMINDGNPVMTLGYLEYMKNEISNDMFAGRISDSFSFAKDLIGKLRDDYDE